MVALNRKHPAAADRSATPSVAVPAPTDDSAGGQPAADTPSARLLGYSNSGPRTARRVALTFDDGPGALTGQLLDVLGAAGARATFNVLGGRVSGREELLRRTLREGHEIGNHGVDHECLAGRPLAAHRQIRRTNAAVVDAVGCRPRIFRAPYGAVSPAVIATARLSRMRTLGWNVDPRDYETPGEDAIYERVVGGVGPGSIVLLHDDRRALEQTVFAVERILVTLRERGYRFVTVSELLG